MSPHIFEPFTDKEIRIIDAINKDELVIAREQNDIVNVMTETQAALGVTSRLELEQALSNSNELDLYFEEFFIASEQLIERCRCTVADFREVGVWEKVFSVN